MDTVPSARFVHTAIASAPIESVWATLDEPSTWESIEGIDDVVDPLIDPEGRLIGFSFDSNVAGKAYRGIAASAGRDEGRMLAWEIENSEITGLVMVELNASNPGTEITVTLDVSARGLLSSMFFSLVANTIGSGLPRSVDEFADSFE